LWNGPKAYGRRARLQLGTTLGVPTIITAIPMNADLVHSGFCGIIPADGLEPATYEGGVFGAWSRVRTEDIAQAIKEVYQDQCVAVQRARKGARWIEREMA
jgi:hypothetical protein